MNTSRPDDGATGSEVLSRGRLIINADDWGRDEETTRATLACIMRGSVSAASAMVFMEDSERAAELAARHEIDAGLHLNFTSAFTASGVPRRLAEHQERLARYLRPSRFASAVFNPLLSGSFEYVVGVQLEEYRRLYGRDAVRIDGHHHMHLCANVLLQKLLPAGVLARRSFSFQAGEKSFVNRWYRKAINSRLQRRCRTVDALYNLMPVESGRLERIFMQARHSVVELETHPINHEEYQFLMNGAIFRAARELTIERGFAAAFSGERAK